MFSRYKREFCCYQRTTGICIHKDSIKDMKKYILLAGILLLGIILRSYQLNLFPNGFFSDEAAIEYSGYKILTTGKDEYGVLFPFFFKSLGDYRNPVSIYSSIPFILLFGLSEFSARFVTAVYGTFTVLVVFLFVSRIFSHKTGLIAAFLLSISAWHIHISRWGAEYAPYPFFVLLTCFFIVSSFKKQRFLIWAAVTGGIGFYTYYPSWIVIPIVFFTGIFYWFIVNRRKITWVPFIAVIIFMCSFFPLAMGIREGHALTRWDRVTNNTVALSEKINKYFLYYKDHFLPLYLFQKGDLEYPGRFITRQFVNREGFLYRFTALFILFGIIISILKRKTGWPLIIVLLLIYPLGSALTLEGPSTTRSFIGILPFVILPGLGIGGFIKFLNKWKLIQFVMVIGLVVISSFELHRYIKNYYIDYPLI